MTWTSSHSRSEVLRDVMEAADRRRDGLLPMDLEGVAEKFDGELDLLGTLQLKWHTRLAGRIEEVFIEQPMDLEESVVTAWHQVAAEMPGARAIIDHYLEEPLDGTMARLMTKAIGKEYVLLAVMAGNAAVADDLAATLGRRISERARSSYVPQAIAAAPSGLRQPGLLARIKAALAA